MARKLRIEFEGAFYDVISLGNRNKSEAPRPLGGKLHNNLEYPQGA
jgi:hypothetical protein